MCSINRALKRPSRSINTGTHRVGSSRLHFHVILKKRVFTFVKSIPKRIVNHDVYNRPMFAKRKQSACRISLIRALPDKRVKRVAKRAHERVVICLSAHSILQAYARLKADSQSIAREPHRTIPDARIISRWPFTDSSSSYQSTDRPIGRKLDIFPFARSLSSRKIARASGHN